MTVNLDGFLRPLETFNYQKLHEFAEVLYGKDVVLLWTIDKMK